MHSPWARSPWMAANWFAGYETPVCAAAAGAPTSPAGEWSSFVEWSRGGGCHLSGQGQGLDRGQPGDADQVAGQRRGQTLRRVGGHAGQLQERFHRGFVEGGEAEALGEQGNPLGSGHGASVGFALVSAEDELVVSAAVRIPWRELEWRFGPSGGPGGQHANRAHTRAEVRFDVNASTSLRPADRDRLLEQLGPVVSAGADDQRSQLRNRHLAAERLRRTLAAALRTAPPRRPTRPRRGAVEARLNAKRQQAARKRDRGPVRGDE